MEPVELCVEDIPPCGCCIGYVDENEDTDARRKVHNEQEFEKLEGTIHLSSDPSMGISVGRIIRMSTCPTIRHACLHSYRLHQAG